MPDLAVFSKHDGRLADLSAAGQTFAPTDRSSGHNGPEGV